MSGQRVSLRLGTRGSALARAQSELVADALRERGAMVELVVVQTEGDRRAPDTAWGEGAFVTALERALVEGSIDVAVHSAKDLPLRCDPRLTVAAFPRRADPRDALLARQRGATLASLPPGTRVGTDSPRRAGFLRAGRPDLNVCPLHGNVDTRIRRLDAGEVDAIVLAIAGLERLGRLDRIDEALDPSIVPPAPGQGALAVQVRADDGAILALAAALDHPATRAAVLAERAFLQDSGGGCRAPIGALGTVEGDQLTLAGAYVRADGTGAVRAAVRGPVDRPEQLAQALAERLGTRPDLLAAGRSPDEAVPRTGPRVMVTRPAAQADSLTTALRAHGLEPIVVPAIRIDPLKEAGPLEEALRDLGTFDWVVLTSANAVASLAAAAGRLSIDLPPAGVPGHATHWAAVGGATAAAMRDLGIPVEFVPTIATGDALGRELPVRRGQRVLLPRAARGGAELPARLRAAGAHVLEVVTYRTTEGPAESRPLLEQALRDDVAAVVFSSGSTVRGLLSLAGGPGSPDADRLRRTPAVCVGPSTAAAARAGGFERVVESATQRPEAVAEAVVELVRHPLPAPS